MGDRIRYGRKKRWGWLWLLAVLPAAGVLALWDGWYWELARYVGVCIRGG